MSLNKDFILIENLKKQVAPFSYETFLDQVCLNLKHQAGIWQLQSQQQLVQQQMSRGLNPAVTNTTGSHRNHIMNSVASNNTSASSRGSAGGGGVPNIHNNMMLAPLQQNAKVPSQQQQPSQNIGKSSILVVPISVHSFKFMKNKSF